MMYTPWFAGSWLEEHFVFAMNHRIAHGVDELESLPHVPLSVTPHVTIGQRLAQERDLLIAELRASHIEIS